MIKCTESYPGNQADIRQIHVRALAVENQLYYENTGKVYIGTKGGRLREYTRANIADNNIADNTEDINTNTESIEALRERVVTLENTKADKCFAIAMGIVL